MIKYATKLQFVSIGEYKINKKRPPTPPKRQTNKKTKKSNTQLWNSGHYEKPLYIITVIIGNTKLEQNLTIILKLSHIKQTKLGKSIRANKELKKGIFNTSLLSIIAYADNNSFLKFEFCINLSNKTAAILKYMRRKNSFENVKCKKSYKNISIFVWNFLATEIYILWNSFGWSLKNWNKIVKFEWSSLLTTNENVCVYAQILCAIWENFIIHKF